MKVHCPERLALSFRVAQAIQAVYLIRDSTGQNRAILLRDARFTERFAERELTAHVKERGCKL
jgi:hypothetical protein